MRRRFSVCMFNLSVTSDRIFWVEIDQSVYLDPKHGVKLCTELLGGSVMLEL